MAVLISLGGNSAGDGFLVAPVGSTYDAEITVSTDSGTLPVTLQASPNTAGLVFSQTNLTLSTTPTVVNVHATLQSTARGDTTIQVLDGATPGATFTVTSISHPKVHFRGRFEARFATDGSFYNRNPTEWPDAAGPSWTRRQRARDYRSALPLMNAGHCSAKLAHHRNEYVRSCT
jgi:hypothetical protein